MADLVQRIRSLARPLAPIPTHAAARLAPLPGVRAVLFDLYGTLFVSGAGEVGATAETPAEPRLSAAIRRHHEAARATGIDHPEVDLLSIWRDLAGGDEALAETRAIDCEWSVNPVWPMPGAAGMLRALRGQGVLLGIVSNAQFFTPPLFEALMGSDATALGFEAGACAWSYQSGRAKPSPHLFHRAMDAWVRRGIRPGEILMVGNDMRNDVLAAAACGMRTALFAGDARSLRLRGRSTVETPPDLVLTELEQLPPLLGRF
ncbi:MAG: HAD family hydrolase [Kiritimatiellia bacterium]